MSGKPVSPQDLWKGFFNILSVFFLKTQSTLPSVEFRGALALLRCSDDDKTGSLEGLSMIDAPHYCASLTELYAKPRCVLGSLSPGNFPAFYRHYNPITTCLKNNPNQKQQLGFLGEFSLKKKKERKKERKPTQKKSFHLEVSGTLFCKPSAILACPTFKQCHS